MSWVALISNLRVRKYWQLTSSWKSIQLRNWADNCKSGGDSCWPHWVFFDQETRSTNLRNLIFFTVINRSFNWSNYFLTVIKIRFQSWPIFHTWCTTAWPGQIWKKGKSQRQILMQHQSLLQFHFLDSVVVSKNYCTMCSFIIAI